MIEHVSTREQQDGDQTNSSPQVAVLNDRCDIRVCNGDEGEQTQYDGD
jgi:hypothetical protein